MGTPDAARKLVKLLAAGKDEIAGCVERTASPDAASAELQRLMLEPETAVSSAFFNALVRLQRREQAKQAQLPMVEREAVAAQRNLLFAAIEKKQSDALITSLATVLRNPPQSPQRTYEFAYKVPLDDPVIRMAAANFDRLPEQAREWLLKDGWAGVLSPLMLDVVRRSAGDAGCGKVTGYNS